MIPDGDEPPPGDAVDGEDDFAFARTCVERLFEYHRAPTHLADGKSSALKKQFHLDVGGVPQRRSGDDHVGGFG